MTTRFFGFILFIGGLLLFAANYKTLKIQYQGEIVDMQILDLPATCLGTKSNHFVKLQYEGTVFIKKIGGKYCEEHRIGEMVEMKYLEGMSVVLFPNESAAQNLVACILLSVMGLVTLFIGGRRK